MNNGKHFTIAFVVAVVFGYLLSEGGLNDGYVGTLSTLSFFAYMMFAHHMKWVD